MKSRKTLISILVAAASVAVIVGTVLFARFVQDSLWEKSVTDVLEVTAQGQHALDTYFEKDLDTLDLLAAELSVQRHDDEDRLIEKLALFGMDDDGTVYVCVDLNTARCTARTTPTLRGSRTSRWPRPPRPPIGACWSRFWTSARAAT